MTTDNRTNETIMPDLVTISYRKDGKDYLLSMPSGHAEWAEEMLNTDREAVERAAAEKALTEAADATLREAPGEPHAGATFESHAVWLRARAEAYRREGKGQ